MVAGPQIGRGYLGLPEETARAFVTNPFDSSPAYTRAYRTGDLVRWLDDGTLECCGRIGGDTQVKVRGHRIELGDI